MSAPNVPDEKKSKSASVPRWVAVIVALVAWFVGVPLVYAVLPWAISLLTPRYGWNEGHPGIWNLPGLIPVVIGTACLIWIMVLHFARMPEVPERVELHDR